MREGAEHRCDSCGGLCGSVGAGDHRQVTVQKERDVSEPGDNTKEAAVILWILSAATTHKVRVEQIKRSTAFSQRTTFEPLKDMMMSPFYFTFHPRRR